jgi:hypothetical protein
LRARWDQDVGFTLFGKPLADAYFEGASIEGSSIFASWDCNESGETVEEVYSELRLSFVELLTADEEQKILGAIRARVEPALKKIGNPELAKFVSPSYILIAGYFGGTGGDHMPHAKGAMLKQDFQFRLQSSGLTSKYSLQKKGKSIKSSRTVDFSDF